MADMQEITIPLIIRGEIIEDDLVDYPPRGQGPLIRSIDVKRHLRKLVMRDPGALRDLYALSLDEIIDFFGKLAPLLDRHTNPHIAAALKNSEKTSSYSPAMLASIFDSMPGVLSREYISLYIDKAIGRDVLEGWVDHHLPDRVTSVRAFGARAAHIIAGNSPAIALLTFILNGISRSDAIIKVPSNDPFFAPAVARTMIDMAPDHPITRHVSVAYWRGGDAAVEKPLYDPANLEKIVAWGGFASMGSIREYLGPGLDLVALDPKLSASILGREAFADDARMREIAMRLATDIGAFNQAGCVNARVIYIETGTDDDGIEIANLFGQYVFEAMMALPPEKSSIHPAFDPVLKNELSGLRYSDDFRIFGGKHAEGAVIVSQEDEPVDFADRLDCRVANLVPINSIDEAVAKITIYTQTIGVYPDSLKARIREECALRGGQRLTSLGNATSGNFIGPHDGIEPLRRMVRWAKDETMGMSSGLMG